MTFNHTRTRRLLALLSLAVAALLLLSCSDDATDETMQVDDVWVQPTDPGAENVSFYATIRNTGDVEDRLVAAHSGNCESLEVHRTEMIDGVVEMRPVEGAEVLIPAGGSLLLEPGGLHVMCIGLRESLVEGESASFELEFDVRGVVPVVAAIENRP